MNISGPGDRRLGLGKHWRSRGGVRGYPAEGHTGRFPGVPVASVRELGPSWGACPGRDRSLSSAGGDVR